MIVTGEKISTIKLVEDNSITVIDDVNKENIEQIKATVEVCDKFIDKKFELPTTKNEVITKRSKTISKVYECLTEMHNALLNNKSQYFSSETQFTNFKIKIIFWCTNIFEDVVNHLDNDGSALLVINNNNISKHEIMFVNMLNKAGATVLIISNKNECESILKNNNSLIIKKYGTTENLTIDNKLADRNKSVSAYGIVVRKSLREFGSLQEVEDAIYNKHETIKLIVSGTSIYIDTCDFYAKLYNESTKNPEFVLYTTGFHKPSYNETNAFPRLRINNHSYIIETALKFLDVKNSEIKTELEEALRMQFNKPEYRCLTPEILSNKIFYSICIINNILKDETKKFIIYYGNVTNNDSVILQILSNVESLSYIVLTSDKSKRVTIDNVYTLELPNSVEYFAIPTVDSRDNASTMAAQAARRVNQTLYSGDTIGMYKPGQFRTCNTKRFTTTFDEIVMWWNKEMYIRPGFESQGDVAIIPTMFKVIKGVYPDDYEYANYIKKLACGKTIVFRVVKQIRELSDFYPNCNNDNRYQGGFIHRLTDIHNTKFEDQRPFYENGKLNKKRIINGINYKYKFLNKNKQDLIFDKIEEIINKGYINESSFKDKEAFIDTVLNLLLNINIEVLQYIQWFEFYTYNPNLIVILNDIQMPSVNDTILMLFLSLMGFDVLIFVPTAYSGVEDHITNKFSYDTHTIGEAAYDIDFDNIQVTPNIEVDQEETKKKQGFFSKLFNK